MVSNTSFYTPWSTLDDELDSELANLRINPAHGADQRNFVVWESEKEINRRGWKKREKGEQSNTRSNTIQRV